MLKAHSKDPNHYTDREFSNDYVKHQISQKLKTEKKKPRLMLSELHKQCRVAYLAKFIAAGDDDPGAAVAFDTVTLKPTDHGTLHVGQQRVHWYKKNMEDMWQET